MVITKRYLAWAVLTIHCAIAPFSVVSSNTEMPVCFYVNSYQEGDEWSDGITRALREVLAGQCDVIQFDMNTRHHRSSHDSELAGRAAYEMMKTIRPDIIITSDDAAAQYFISPYAGKVTTPVVFTGINWTVNDYEFAPGNSTGMIESAPIEELLIEGLKTVGKYRSAHNRVVYLGANSTSERKDFNHLFQLSARLGLKPDAILVDDFSEWLFGFELAQNYDLIILGSKAGVKNWNSTVARQVAEKRSRKISLTSHEEMIDYALIGHTTVAEEQGYWAGKTVIEILSGAQMSEIPVVTSRRWDIWFNTTIQEAAQVELSNELLRSAKKN